MFTPSMSGWLRLESRLPESRLRSPGSEEMWIEDPDGVRIVLVRFLPITLSAATRGRRYR
jgi:hypothetical protein